MSHVATNPDTPKTPGTPAAPTNTTHTEGAPLVHHWKAPIGFAVLTAVALLFFAILGPDGTATFRLSQEQDAIQLPPLVIPAKAAGYVIAFICAAITVLAYRKVQQTGKTPGWMSAVIAVAFVAGFLIWLVGGTNSTTVSLVGLLTGAMLIVVPIAYGALSGIMSERAGVVNIAIEGQLLGGAFTAALVGSMTGNAFAGLFAAALAGVLVSLVLASFAIKYLVNQIIVGVVLNVLVSGLTGFFYEKFMASPTSPLNQPPRMPAIKIPLLGDIPVIGPLFFNQSILGYLLLVLVAGIWWALFRSKWGLRVRAVGEHPQAADTLGINVNRTRFWNVVLGGAIAGVGGAYFTLVATSAFSKDMSGGLGFIALAAMIFGRWNPIGAFLAAMLFGVARNLESNLSVAGSAVPGEFLNMLPYALTILAVSGLVGRARPPAASGVPYVKG